MKSVQIGYIIILLTCLALCSPSEASSPKKLRSSAVVVGTVYCDTCFHQDFSKGSHFISGATVAIECRDRSVRRPSGLFRQVVKTNEQGEFRVHLPFSISKHIKKIKGCSVKLISSSEPFCAVGATATSSSLRLKSKKEGTHIFTAGFFTFRPLKQPEVCDQKPSSLPSKFNVEKPTVSYPDNPTFLPSTGQTDLPPLPALPKLPSLPELPPVPLLPGNIPPLPAQPTLPPLPELPPLPLVPGNVPFIPPVPNTVASPQHMKMISHQSLIPFFPPLPLLPPPMFPSIPSLPPPMLPPNPLLPPPSVLPPNPFLPPPSIFPPILPSPPPSIFPPILPSPPPSMFPPVLPIPSPPPSIFPPFLPFPGSPPPPPPSIFPPVFPFPGSPSPIPFPPLIPGIPPSPRPS